MEMIDVADVDILYYECFYPQHDNDIDMQIDVVVDVRLALCVLVRYNHGLYIQAWEELNEIHDLVLNKGNNFHRGLHLQK